MSNNVMIKGAEITKLENDLVVIGEEVDKKKRILDDLQAQIDRKTSDFEIYISQRDAETKRLHTDINVQREKLNADKAEFQTILQTHRLEKAAIEQQKREFDIQKLRFDATKQNVQAFITAVRRANGLLGF